MAVPYEKIVEEDLNVGPRADVTVTMPGGGSATGHQLALSSLSEPKGGTTQVWDPAAVAQAATVSTTAAVPDAKVGDLVAVSFSTLQAGCFVFGRVSSADVVTVNLFNLSGATIDHASGTLRVLVFREVA